jgi:predicted enzyme related to lactoylglutathione lyase
MSVLHTRDPEGSKAFYGAVFGWKAETMDMGGGEFTLWRLPGYAGGEPEQPVPRDVVGVMLKVSRDRFPDDVPPHWRVDFWVYDTDATADKASKLGGKVVVAPFEIPAGGPGRPARRPVLRERVEAGRLADADGITEPSSGKTTRRESERQRWRRDDSPPLERLDRAFRARCSRARERGRFRRERSEKGCAKCGSSFQSGVGGRS